MLNVEGAFRRKIDFHAPAFFPRRFQADLCVRNAADVVVTAKVAGAGTL
jgi:hypothetical protein